MCFCPIFVADRPGRPTARVDRTKGRSTLAVDRRAQIVHVWQTQGRSAGRPTGPESFALCIWAVGRAADRIAQRSYFWPLAVGRAGRPLACQAARSA